MNETAVAQLLLQEFPFEPTPGQAQVIIKLAEFLSGEWDDKQSLFVLKGYAGTGKTTIVTSLANVLPKIMKRTVLLAPTGRAAKVLAGYAKKPAHTIHRKIYFAFTTKDGTISLRLQKNLHKQTLFIVDEASMIQNSSLSETSLFSTRNLLDDLFLYVFGGECNKVLFIGDSAQLPPVGSEYSPALDLEFLRHSYNLKTDSFELTEVVRQAQKSGILMNATGVREKIRIGKWALPLFYISAYKDIIRLTGTDLEDALNSAYSGSSRENNVVICRSNKRANIFNKEIRKRILYLEEDINTGDNMMVVKNNYFWLPEGSAPGFIANGDLIEILRIRKIEELYGFRFADVSIRFIDYPEEKEMDVKIILDTIMMEGPALNQVENNRLFNEVMKDYEELTSRRARVEKVKLNPYFNALQVKFSYALTCHKTQGGQWDTVFVDQGYLNEKMMNVEYLRWLYTAVTRATKKVFLVNFEAKFFNETL